jgi:ketosteroid isomerase-like protein
MNFRIALPLGVLLSLVSLSPSAAQVEEEITLKEGSSVIVFADGEMAMRDSKGRPFSMQQGHVMETRDGKQIRMARDNPSRKSKAEQDREDMYRGA